MSSAETQPLTVHRKLGHVPVLDGVRGLAILMVLFAHFNGETVLKEFFPVAGPIYTKFALAGLMGVDLFFMLSGFLITSILLDSKNTEGYFRNFYARRVLRIFPLYYGALLLVFWILPSFISYDSAARNFLDHQWVLWAYLSNLPFSENIDWDGSNTIMMGHFWSLAVEEHFYLMWPLIVYVSSLDKLKRICLLWTVTSVLIGLFSAMPGIHETSPLIGWSTLTFSGSLTLGAYLAAIYYEGEGLTKLRPMALKYLPVMALCFFIFVLLPRGWGEWSGVFAYIKHGLSWFVFAGLFVVLLTSTEKSILNSFFELPFIRFFGKLSYGLYVYHGIFRPLFEKFFDRHELISITGSPLLGVVLYFIICISITVLISWISWHFFEKYFLKLKRYFKTLERKSDSSLQESSL